MVTAHNFGGARTRSNFDYFSSAFAERAETNPFGLRVDLSALLGTWIVAEYGCVAAIDSPVNYQNQFSALSDSPC